MLLAEKEKVLVIFRRLFERDIRQHFVGTVEAVTPITLRAHGFTFIFDVDNGKFIRKPNPSTRLIPLGQSHVLISVLPTTVDPKRIIYQTDTQNQLIITDNQGFSQSMAEFSGRYNSVR